MNFLQLLSTFNDGLVLIYGLFLSIQIAGGGCSRQQYKQLIFVLCPLFLLLQCILGWYWGAEMVRYLYPLIIHLPLVLILVFILKKQGIVAFISVCTAYLFCQLPRWVMLIFTLLTDSLLIGEISYTLSATFFYWFLHRYFVSVAYDAMSYSRQNLILFGSLPAAYYVFDYSTAIYSNILYEGIPALTEFLPTALIVFYLGFITAYHAQTQKRTEAELQSSMLSIELKQAGSELENLRYMETQAKIYRHDLRHHLNAIEGFLSTGNFQQAENYIHQVQSDVESITPIRFCENELLNLLCSSFSSKAKRMGIRLTVEASVPEKLSVPDTELCSLLSNALENALQAVNLTDGSDKWAKLCCSIKSSKILIEINNPFDGQITMRNGLPQSKHQGHGYGCRSIQSIVQHNHGTCFFETKDNIFILRVILPM